MFLIVSGGKFPVSYFLSGFVRWLGAMYQLFLRRGRCKGGSWRGSEGFSQQTKAEIPVACMSYLYKQMCVVRGPALVNLSYPILDRDASGYYVIYEPGGRKFEFRNFLPRRSPVNWWLDRISSSNREAWIGAKKGQSTATPATTSPFARPMES